MFTRIVRSVYSVLIALFLLAIPVQFFFAGLGAFKAFKGASAWDPHLILGDLLTLLALLILLTGLASRLPRPLLILTIVFFVDMVLQFALAQSKDSLKGIAALHPVNALVLIGLAGMLLNRSRMYSPIAGIRPRAVVPEADAATVGP